MKVIKYTFQGNLVEMAWNEINEEIAKQEADNGLYTIESIAADETTGVA